MIASSSGMQLVDGIPIWGGADENTLTQIKQCREKAVHVALMSDNHLGYSVPIGGVVAYRDAISPSGIGFDISCGNKAVHTDMTGAEARANIKQIVDDIQKTISFGMGRHNNERVDHELFDDPAWDEIKHLNLRDKAAAQLGTVGSGNHYVDIFTDTADDSVWVGVHFGSRGLGHGIATWALKAGGAVDSMMAPPLVLGPGELQETYVVAMNLAGAYAYAGRDWVCARVVKILGAKVIGEVHNHHNYAWHEVHDGEWLWVVRKGATPAFPGQRGFVGGTMGDLAVILEGVDAQNQPGKSISYCLETAEEQRQALFSTVHGAGRAMSRTVAAGKYKKGKLVKEGLISSEFGIRNSWELTDWLRDHREVELRGAGLDEAPQAYKRLSDVLEHHRKTVNVLSVLKPIGVVMASADVRDPYKD